jgi:hypothetical protein
MARHHSKSKNANAYLDETATRREVLTCVSQLLLKHEQQHHAANESVMQGFLKKGRATFGKPGRAARVLGWLRGA